MKVGLRNFTYCTCERSGRRMCLVSNILSCFRNLSDAVTRGHSHRLHLCRVSVYSSRSIVVISAKPITFQGGWSKPKWRRLRCPCTGNAVFPLLSSIAIIPSFDGIVSHNIAICWGKNWSCIYLIVYALEMRFSHFAVRIHQRILLLLTYENCHGHFNMLLILFRPVILPALSPSVRKNSNR